MSRCLPAAVLLAAAPLVAGCAGEARADTPGALTGFRVELNDEQRPAAGPAGAGQVTWESSWTLSWDLVPEIESYAVYYGTNEGNSASESERLVRVPSLRIQAAAGTSPPERLAQDRAAGLLLTSSALLVSVAGVNSEGQQGPKSPWFPVGDAPADGRPIAMTQVDASAPAPDIVRHRTSIPERAVMRVLFIQHDHTSPPGVIGERFSERGYGVEEFLIVPADRYLDPGVTVDFPDPTGFDALVPMGSPWSVYDTALIGPWVEPELELLRRASAEGVPVLGLCFGGQLLAAAHGGSVVRTEVPEVGWHVVHTDEPELLAPGPWFQWHFDRWQTPPDAREIARNGAASQAFVVGRNLALQFHPELDPAMLTGWLDNGGAPALAELGYDVPAIIEQTRTESPAARTRAHRLVDAFLDRVARNPVIIGS